MLRQKQKAFTLVETVAATLILSISVVVLSGIGVHSLKAAHAITTSEQAWDLVDRQLTMIDYIGITSYKLEGPTQGTFDNDGTEFFWQLEIEDTELDSVYDVAITVSWTEHLKAKQIESQTRFCSY